MATFKELGSEYFVRLTSSSVPEREFERILSEINKLVYSVSKQSLSNEDKAKIVEIIIEELETFYRGPKRIFEETEIIKAFSNDNYLELINYIKTRTKK